MATPRSYPNLTDELVGLQSHLPNATFLDFLKWAFCDPCDDDIKGIFAEWLVMKILAQESQRRISWANSDLILSNKVRIEVKASSYWQSYKHINEFGEERVERIPVADRARIRFSGLIAKDADGQNPDLKRGHKSDIYVFAFQNEKDLEKWNAMDLSQWEFYVVGKEQLRYASIGLVGLEKFGKLTVNELANAVSTKIAALEATV